MKVDWKDPADAERLRGLIADASNAKQRDRCLVALIAGTGLAGKPELQREEIAATVGRSRQFADQQVRHFCQGGVDALVPKRQAGATPKLTGEQQRQLCATLESGVRY
jgi:transposase